MRKSWNESVKFVIYRLIGDKRGVGFTREQLISTELDRIVYETQSTGVTPEQTLSRVLQELRDGEFIEFSDNDGFYRLL